MIKIKKIISLILALLIISITPYGSYIQGENAKVYALELTIDEALNKFIMPVAAYMAIQYDKTMEGIENFQASVSDLTNKLADMYKQDNELKSSIPKLTKAVVAKIYTDLTTSDINTALGTNFTEQQIYDASQTLNQRKIDGLIGSSYRDLYDLGISHIFANVVKNTNNGLNSNITIYKTDIDGLKIYIKTGDPDTIKSPIEPKPFTILANDFWKLFNKTVYVTSTADLYSVGTNQTSLYSNQYYYISPTYRIYFQTWSKRVRNMDHSYFNYIEDTIYNDNPLHTSNSKVYIQSLAVGKWNNVYSNSDLYNLKMNVFLDNLKSNTNIDLTNSNYYSDNIYVKDIINKTFIGTTVLNDVGSYSIPLSIPTIDSGFWTGEDVSELPEERLIANRGTGAITYDVNVEYDTKVNDDPDTNEEIPFITDVKVGPTDLADDTPSVDTSNPDDNIPDEGTEDPPDSGVIGNLLAPIIALLQSILDWLKSLLEALKLMFVSLFVPSQGFLENYFTDLQNMLSDSFGLLYYPFELLVSFVNRYLSIPNEGDIIIDVKALKIPYKGQEYIIFPAYTFNFNTIFNLNGFGTIRNIYLVVVDVIVIFALVNLLAKKYKEVIR